MARGAMNALSSCGPAMDWATTADCSIYRRCSLIRLSLGASTASTRPGMWSTAQRSVKRLWRQGWSGIASRSEEHTSELQSRVDVVCRLLLEKKNSTLIEKQCCE